MNTPNMESTWKALLEQVSAVGDRLGDSDPLDKVDTAIEELVFYDDTLDVGTYLVHYTSWESALAILEEPEPLLRSYNFERTNDPQEGRLWRRIWGGLRNKSKWFDKLLPSFDQTLLSSGRSTGSTFGCCFSAGGPGVEDNLTFWRLYGNDGKGCSFKVTSYLSKTYRVRYLDEHGNNRSDDEEELDRRVGSWLDDLLTIGRQLVEQFLSNGRKDVARRMAASIRKVLGGYNHLVKSSYFEDEKEWRMIDVSPPAVSILYHTDKAGVVRRYVPGLSLKHGLITGSSVTVGPQVPNGGAARAYVEHLARAKGLDVSSPAAGGSYDRWPAVNLSKQSYRSGV